MDVLATSIIAHHCLKLQAPRQSVPGALQSGDFDDAGMVSMSRRKDGTLMNDEKQACCTLHIFEMAIFHSRKERRGISSLAKTPCLRSRENLVCIHLYTEHGNNPPRRKRVRYN